RDVEAEIHARLGRGEPAQPGADARQLGLVAHFAEGGRNLPRAGECHGAEAAAKREAVLPLHGEHAAVAVAADLVAPQVIAAAVEAEVEEGRALGGTAGVATQRKHAGPEAMVVVGAQRKAAVGAVAAKAVFGE